MDNIEPYWLFLDDVRAPYDVKWSVISCGKGREYGIPPRNWTVVRDYNEFVAIIEKQGMPEAITFDHDLADFNPLARISLATWNERTGLDCAKWLIANKIVLEHFTVHSANPVGAKNITCLLNNYAKFRRNNID